MYGHVYGLALKREPPVGLRDGGECASAGRHRLLRDRLELSSLALESAHLCMVLVSASADRWERRLAVLLGRRSGTAMRWEHAELAL